MQECRAYVIKDHVEQPKFCGHGNSLSEAINSIEYVEGKNSFGILDLVEYCERSHSHLMVVVFAGGSKRTFSPEEVKGMFS
jgi:hypothetical protein